MDAELIRSPEKMKAAYASAREALQVPTKSWMIPHEEQPVSLRTVAIPRAYRREISVSLYALGLALFAWAAWPRRQRRQTEEAAS